VIESKTLQEVLTYLKDELGGDWLLTGGSLVRLGFDSSRGTEDIDLVRIRHPEFSDEKSRNELFQWLLKRGLGPEWVNTAVEPFVREVPSWERELVRLQSGTRGQIFRPNLTLFVYLKLRRGSEIDLGDIRTVAPQCPEGFDEARFMSWADQKLQTRFRAQRSALGI
jgi:hypothetical protein